MSSAKFRSDHDATQDRSDVIHFPEHRLWGAEARLRKAAAKAKSLEEMRALYLLRFYVVQAIVGPNAVWNGPRLLKTPTMPFHPAAAMLPMMDKDEAEALTVSIKRHGLQKPDQAIYRRLDPRRPQSLLRFSGGRRRAIV
jgi:hypothetical protein